MGLTRRAFLATAAAAAAVRPSFCSATNLHLSVADAVQTAKGTFPGADTLMKFHDDGSVRPFAGNTVICHMPAQCAMRDVMAEFREGLRTSPFRKRLGLTTVDSYHVTIFPGANDQGRTASGWPAYVARDATIEQCSAAVMERMQQLRLQCELPFRVAVDIPATLAYPRACTLRMKALDEREEKKLRSVRDQISAAYGFRLPNHAEYGFHITMSYQMTPFSNEERQQFGAMRDAFVKKIVAAQPVLELGNPEYCTFPDMLRFEPKLLLSCS